MADNPSELPTQLFRLLPCIDVQSEFPDTCTSGIKIIHRYHTHACMHALLKTCTKFSLYVLEFLEPVLDPFFSPLLCGSFMSVSTPTFQSSQGSRGFYVLCLARLKVSLPNVSPGLPTWVPQGSPMEHAKLCYLLLCLLHIW